jgi:hypothetical protein
MTAQSAKPIRVGNVVRGCSLALLCMAASLARADMDCTGTLTAVLMYSDGSVLIRSSWRNDYTRLCGTQDGVVATEVCLAWYGAAIKAKADNKTVSVYYYGTPSSSCATLPTYNNTPKPAYFGFL